MNPATSTPVKSAIEKARERLAREQEKLAELEAEAAMREELVANFKAGVSIEALANIAGMPPEKMRALLVAEGAIVARKRMISDEERGRVAAALRAGMDAPGVARDLNIAEAVVRRIARELGIVRPAARRTDAQMQQLAAFEEQVKQAYGAGFAALGEALRSWRKRQAQAEGYVQEIETPVAKQELQALQRAHAKLTNVAPFDPEVEPLPAPVAPPSLTPEDEAKMNEPDSDTPW